MATTDKKVIVIAGPTAVGKTKIGIDIACLFKTEVISADSRQCYKEMDIGVARPSTEELSEVKHHFIASHSIHDKVNAAVFEQYALDKAINIFKSNNHLILVGGTGLYIKAFLEGLDEIPEVAEDIRNEIIEKYYEYGLNWLQEQVRIADPLFYKAGEVKNPQRLMRALEVIRGTGRSIVEYRTGNKSNREFKVIKIALEIAKDDLHNNINARVDRMIEMGLVNEVLDLYPYRNLTALQTVGYKEIIEHLEGKMTLNEAVELIKANTRKYAKRQLTWFKKDKEYQWCSPNQTEIINQIKKAS